MFKALLPTVAVLGGVAVAAPALAQMGGGSNFGMFVYPPHQCGVRPVPPYRPAEFRSYTETQDYNIRVEQYNAELNHFASCINAYVERTRRDSDLIRQRAEEAIRALR